MSERHHTRLVLSSSAAILTLGLAWTGCFKSLPSLDDAFGPDSGASGSGGTAGGAGGVAGTAASGGGGASAGSGGTAGATSDAGDDADAATGPILVPYSDVRHPISAIENSMLNPLVIAADDDTVYRAQKDAAMATIVSRDITSGTGGPLSGGIERPQAMVAPGNGAFVWIAGGFEGLPGQGRVFRISKSGGGLVTITDVVPDSGPPNTGRILAIEHDPRENKIYFTSQTPDPGDPQVLRVGMMQADVRAEVVYFSESGGEMTVTDVTAADGCVYWLSSGAVYTISENGAASRNDAVAMQISDGVGLASDDNFFYYTRANGSVWRRGHSFSCDGTGDPEEMIHDGYVEIGDVITYQNKVAWFATGDRAMGFAGGGIFQYDEARNEIETISPSDDGIEAITQSPSFVIFANASGLIKRVTK